MPTTRFRVRTLMIAVAAVATVLACVVARDRLERKRHRCIERVRIHAECESMATFSGQMAQEAIETSERLLSEFKKPVDEQARLRDGIAKFRKVIARSATQANFHAAMKRKYEHVIDRPWLSIEPEPPWPE